MRLPPIDPEPPIPCELVPAELLAWAHEFLEGVREIEATGGISLDAVLDEIAALASRA